MKVIKASVDLKTWTYKTTCGTCKSQLEIEVSDIRYHWDRNGAYYYTCVLCNVRQLMKDADVPVIVQADVKKHRSDPVVHTDD